MRALEHTLPMPRWWVVNETVQPWRLARWRARKAAEQVQTSTRQGGASFADVVNVNSVQRMLPTVVPLWITGRQQRSRSIPDAFKTTPIRSNSQVRFSSDRSSIRLDAVVDIKDRVAWRVPAHWATVAPAWKGGRARPYGPGSGRYSALDTSDARYRRWYLQQRRRVEDALRYPRERALNRDQGRAVYRLEVRRDGSLAEQPRRIRGTGFTDLDEAARVAIAAAIPFGRVPDDLAPGQSTIQFDLTIEFSNPMVQ